LKALLDHHLKKQGILLWATMGGEGWLKLLEIPMLTFSDVGLLINSSDRSVWRFAQEKQLILLTGNRNSEGEDSLEQTIRNENTPSSLPVVTVSVVRSYGRAGLSRAMRRTTSRNRLEHRKLSRHRTGLHTIK
jgi:hypothetical protein